MRISTPHVSLLATVAVALLSTLGAIGCAADSLPREAVSGMVKVDGKPLKTGLVTFVPIAADIPTQGGANVIDGKYEIARSEGLVPGKYKVVVSSGEGTPEKKVDNTNNMPGMPPIPAKEVIPAQYGTGTVLEANVTSGGKNEFEFNLVKGPAGK